MGSRVLDLFCSMKAGYILYSLRTRTLLDHELKPCENQSPACLAWIKSLCGFCDLL